jgi:Holliday junction resolvase-like predicted endonuclease
LVSLKRQATECWFKRQRSIRIRLDVVAFEQSPVAPLSANHKTGNQPWAKKIERAAFICFLRCLSWTPSRLAS